MYILIGIKYSLDYSVGQVVDCSEANLAAVGHEEWYLVYKKDISRQSHVLVEFENGVGHPHKIRCHMSCLGACGLSFEGCNVLAPYFMGCDDVLYRHGAVLNLVALDHPFEVLQ